MPGIVTIGLDLAKSIFQQSEQKFGPRLIFPLPRRGKIRFNLCVSVQPVVRRVRELVVRLLGEVTELKCVVSEQCGETARLKGLKGRAGRPLRTSLTVVDPHARRAEYERGSTINASDTISHSRRGRFYAGRNGRPSSATFCQERSMVIRHGGPGIILALLPLVAIALSGCSSPAPQDTASVTSLLEMRQQNVVIQRWDLSCGAAALATILRYEWGSPVTERQVALSLMEREAYIEHPELVRIRQGFSLLDLKRYVDAHGFNGVGLGDLDIGDLTHYAPIMVPINALGYNHFVVFRGIRGDRVLLADPAWGNRTMLISQFQRIWLNYGKPIGRVGFVVERPGEPPLDNRLKPKLADFLTFG